ncbi:reticulon-3 isoform X2 [Eublepharis macularius]|uniref:Reticulon n=1 Tax=Eublepharis macularius TaxID=481883 RepID=A0AA97K452_EUBMA|nr:reticulon-3 isoform X2 [Eublepharis macularius]
MAEPATQFPYISSSAGGGSSEPGGRDAKGAGSPQPCADSFVSSSHPVSLFSTSQADAQASHLTHSEKQRETSGKPAPFNTEEFKDGKRLSRYSGTSEDSGIEAASVGSPGPEEPLFSVGSKAHHYEPVNQAGSFVHDNSLGEVNIGSKADLNSYDQPKPAASGGESKFAVPANPGEGPEQLPTRLGYSLSSSCPAAPGDVVDKDSPESPFEVIADKLEFDKEFKDALTSNSNDISGNWVMHSERELLTDIPEDSICEFRMKPRGGGRVPSGPGLSRQSSGTTAALEEVSKCVREMHNFTSEMMSWDLIPKDLGEKANDSVSPDHPASPTEVSSVAAGPAGSKAEAGKISIPHQPLKINAHQKGRTPSGVEKQPSQKRASEEEAAMKNASAVELKADVCWPNPGLPETTDGDSSGESDDTVIEDTVADPAFRGGRAAEGSVQPQKPAFGPIVKKEDVVVDGTDRSREPCKPTQEVGMPSKTPEGSWGFIDDFETVQAKASVLGGSSVGASQFPKRPIPGLPDKGVQDVGICEQGFSRKLPKTKTASLNGTPALGNIKEAVCPDALNGESFMDFMKECLKSKGNESPEDPVETFSEAELKAARSEVLAPHFQQPPKVTQDFEQEHLTIKALKEAGRKTELEKQPLTPIKVSPPGGRQPGQYGERSPEPPAPAQKSALEKRPLCLEQAVDVKLSSASAGFGMHDVPSASSQAPPPELPIPHAIAKLLAEVSVRNLIFWRDVKKTGVVFSTTLILLLSLAAFSVISVISYLILALLSVTISFRVYKSVIQAVQKSEEGHPFKTYLDLDVALSSETFHNYMSSAMVHINHALKLIMRLFLVEDLVDSLKLAVIMWLMTYVGAIFNGITLLILAELLVFSLPVVYEKYKTQIDRSVGIARDQIKSVVSKVQAKVPGIVKKKPE